MEFLILTLHFSKGDSTVVGTSRLRDLYDKFEEELGSRQEKAKAARPPWEPPKTKLDEDLGESQVTRPRLCFYYCLAPAFWDVSLGVPSGNSLFPFIFLNYSRRTHNNGMFFFLIAVFPSHIRQNA